MPNPVFTPAAVRGELLDIAERAAKTFAQTLLASWAVSGLNVFHADWGASFGLALGAALISVLTSLASLPVGQPGTASLTSAVIPTVELNTYSSAATYGGHSAALAAPVAPVAPAAAGAVETGAVQ